MMRVRCIRDFDPCFHFSVIKEGRLVFLKTKAKGFFVILDEDQNQIGLIHEDELRLFFARV